MLRYGQNIQKGSLTVIAVVAWMLPAMGAEFHGAWSQGVERIWVGPEYYANRLQDWRVRDGRLECIETSEERPMRTVHLLAAALNESPKPFSMSVDLGPIEAGETQDARAWAGFLIGVGGEHVDYRLSSLTHHKPAEDGGILVAVDGTGRLTIRDNSKGPDGIVRGPLRDGDLPELPVERGETDERVHLHHDLSDLWLHVSGEPSESEYKLVASVRSGHNDISCADLKNVDPKRLAGNVALVSHGSPRGGELGYWFRDWNLDGKKVVAHPERAFGPVFCAQHTLSDGVLKLTAQMGPLGKQDTQTARLEVRRESGEWHSVAESTLVAHSYTFPFRVENWDGAKDTPYRIAYDLKTGPRETKTYYYEGTIRGEPTDREDVVVAAFTGHRIHVGTPIRWNSSSIWFPHNEVVAAIEHHRPDVLFFSGDQVYEGDLTGAIWGPLDKAMLDYLDKWYRWCWAFGDLARDIPCICIPDDHDVYHGNVWGDGGHATDDFGKGGYYMPAEFVKMVERTQTSHLPDPYDPTPIDQGIGVYYTSMDYGGVSFAIIEDRKWKSPPSILPAEAGEQHGWIRNAAFDAAAHADEVGAHLLGERQLGFLRDWSADWGDGIWMKVVLSQTTFVNLATIPEQDDNDGGAVGVAPLPPGEIAPGQKPARDTDSNGWPPPARDRALREIRRGLALHINGDQHLGSVVHYGIDAWEDAGYSFCVPSIGNIWPRRWYPPTPGENHKPGTPVYTGRYHDGFRNRMTVHAVSNPMVSGHEPIALYDRATGYG
ncbi:MAG: twin-arginine translocation pathway signal protein, partial [Planctomycetes bacterium]|nr:twin-arginine translocation pathway signal protein [Planctomycetota bacterium]